MSYTVIRPADHDGWLKERAKGVGSSEVGTIFGVNHFDTPLKLWRRKVGLDAPVEESTAMLAGHMMEDSVATWFAHDTGAIIDEGSSGDWLAVDDEHPWRRVSPDRLFWPAGTPEEERTLANATMLECKTTTQNVSADEIPDYWFCQTQYQMGVLGLKSCCIAWIKCYGGRFQFGWTTIEFNRPFFETLMEKVDAFWLVNVCKRIEPDTIITLEDASLKWSSAKPGTKAVASEAIVKAVDEYRDKKARSERLADECKACEEAIKIAMKDSEVLVDSSDRILASWKEYEGRASFDGAALKADDPETYNKYVRKGGNYRRFTVKPAKVS